MISPDGKREDLTLLNESLTMGTAEKGILNH